MGYYAKISTNNIVEQVIVASPEVIATYEGTWLETFMDDPAKQYAGIGMGWDGSEFISCPYEGAEWDGAEWVPSAEYEAQAAALVVEVLNAEIP